MACPDSLSRLRERGGARVSPRAERQPCMRGAALLLLALCLLAACGKKGDPVPAGPQDEVIWPRSYPAR